MPADFAIVTDPDGTRHGSNGTIGLSVLPDGPSRLFKRRAIIGVGSPAAYEVMWLVGELAGVRAYLMPEMDNRIALTRADLYPSRTPPPAPSWRIAGEWHVAELDGVRCYRRDDGGRIHVMLTTRDCSGGRATA